MEKQNDSNIEDGIYREKLWRIINEGSKWAEKMKTENEEL